MSIRDDQVRRWAASLIGLCAIGIVGLTASCFSERVTGAEQSCNGTSVPCVVSIRNFAFEPTVLRVPAGATVTWVNNETQAGLAHTSTSDGSGWDSDFLSPGDSYSRAFPSSGQFPYHCEPHPNMKATIIVE